MKVIEHGGTIEIGTSKNTPDGLNRDFRVYAPGPRKLGAAIYAHPSTRRIDFRLPATELSDAERERGAFLRDLEPGNPYVVSIMLDTGAKLPVAGDLAKRAIDAIAQA